MNRRDILKWFGGSAALPAVQAVEQLHLESGDAIVLKFEMHLSDPARAQIKDVFANSWNGRFKDVPILILDGGADIQVLKKAT